MYSRTRYSSRVGLGLAEELNVGLVTIKPVASVSGDLAKDAQGGQPAHNVACDRITGAEELLYLCYGYDRPLVEMLQYPMPVGGRTRQLGRDGSPMPLEEMGQIQNRLNKDSLLAKIKGDEQPPDTSVPIQKRVNGFKLHMGEANLKQGGQIGLLVQQSSLHRPQLRLLRIQLHLKPHLLPHVVRAGGRDVPMSEMLPRSLDAEARCDQ